VSANNRRASDATAKLQKLLWYGRIPVGHLTTIAGPPAAGKSTLGYRIAADVDEPTLFITWEEELETVWRPRLEAAGVDPDKAFHHPEITLGPGATAISADALGSLLRQYAAKLVVVDPLTRHLRGASIHREDQVAMALEPYLAVLKEQGVALVAEVHVLRSVKTSAHPLLAVPAGVASISKAVYLFGRDPTLGADPNVRVLACADKFNFGPTPNSLSFELETRTVSVLDEETGEQVDREFAVWRSRGEVGISARTLLVTLAPETKERKSDRVALFLVELLADGPRPVREIRMRVAELDPPVSWRTVERVANEMGIVASDDPRDARAKVWSLPPDAHAALDEVTEPADEVVIEEIDIPDTPPPDWGPSSDDEEDGENDVA
jgi:hypothetical protein